VLSEYVAVCVGCAGWICSYMCPVRWLNMLAVCVRCAGWIWSCMCRVCWLSILL